MKILSSSRRRRLIQILCLALFLYLLGQAAWPTPAAFPPPDLFLRLDPLAALALPLAAREFIVRLIPGLIVIGLALVLGRIFCGYICPFGFTLDLVAWLKRRLGYRRTTIDSQLHPGWPRVKYGLLIAILTAALAGISLVFWASPTALITRFYALLMYPLALDSAGSILHQGEPLFETLGWTGATYISIKARAFDSLIFLLLFFGLLFWLEWRRPRFWCRALCPAGALLALVSRRPSWRRRVADNCIHCGRCHRDCPAGTISPDGQITGYGECLTCQSCVDICPVQAVEFGFGPEKPQLEKSGDSAVALIRRPLTRRFLLASAAAGLGLAWFQSKGLPAAMRLAAADSEAWPPRPPVRPPGSRPEDRFLALCLRCGECVKACPANALVPSTLTAGLNGLFSPRLLARRGPCEPECNRCGQVCPSGAIANLPLPEKRWAKIGTALILKESCLAWAEDRRCMVCQEVCPYGSIDLVQEAGLATVPVVRASRCFGCGYCEHHCPVEASAIVVEPAGALRLDHDQYRKIALSQGLDLDPEGRILEEISDDQLPPGFLELD